MLAGQSFQQDIRDMNYLLLFILFSSLIAAAYSAVGFERQIKKAGHENSCYDKEEKVFYKQGEIMKWKRKDCGRKICLGADGRGRVYAELQTCGKVGVSPECHVEVNLQLPYPECCEKVVCP